MAGGDDWRVELDAAETHGLARLTESRRLHHIGRDLEQRLEGLRVSVDAHKMFVYAGDEAGVREAAVLLRELADKEQLEVATVTVMRWHPEEERWEDPSVALPSTEAEHRAERERREESERRDTDQLRFPAWEVEVDLPSEEATEALVRRLHAEGIELTERGSAIVLGAATEDDAAALAERMRVEVPEATRITAQGSEAAAWAQLHPFPFLGLGG
jgi:hypothetical protein